MTDEQRHFHTLLPNAAPARLTCTEVSWILKCQPTDIPILVRAKLLKALGKPAENGVKYFSTSKLLSLSRDDDWLGKVTLALQEHWRKKNLCKDRNAQNAVAA